MEPVAGSHFYLEIDGYCPICEQDRRFSAKSDWLRDNFICEGCQSIPRERALINTLNLFYPHWRSLRIHESSPALRASAKIRRECQHYVASQFDPLLGFGNFNSEHEYRSEDLENQTFKDQEFDLVITQDVFEHLFRPDLAIEEIARTLKPGGAHICTVPIGRRSQPTIPRARCEPDGSVTHLLEPIYHGNPMDNSGSLVTYDYGYDIADMFDQASGLNTTIFFQDDLSKGIRAEFIEVLISRKTEYPRFIAESSRSVTSVKKVRQPRRLFGRTRGRLKIGRRLTQIMRLGNPLNRS